MNKRGGLMLLGALLLFFSSCSSPVEPTPVPKTFTLTVNLIDPPGITGLTSKVQAVSKDNKIRLAKASGSSFVLSDLTEGSYTVQALGALGDGVVYFQSSKTESVSSDMTMILNYAESKVLPIKAVTPTENPVAAGSILKFYSYSSSAALKYTLDNTDPTPTNGTLYIPAQGITAPNSSPLKIKIYGYQTGLESSPIAEFTYTVDTNITTRPSFGSAPGQYSSPISLPLYGPDGAVIYYTVDNSEPTEASLVYSNPINISSTTTVKAKAKLPGKQISEILTGEFIIGPSEKLSAPVFNPGSTVFETSQTVKITAAAGASIYYTLDSSTPTEASTLYTKDLVFNSTVVVKAIAVQTGKITSDPSTATYTKTPTPVTAPPTFPNHQSGTYNTNQVVSLSAEAGATIYYNVNEVSDPTESSTSGTSIPLTAEGTYVIKAVAKTAGKLLSGVSQVTITIKYLQRTASPVFNPVSGSYPTGTMISLSCPEAAVIYYTIDGSAPTTSSTTYSSAFNVGGTSVTIKAIAVAAGKEPSLPAEAHYEFSTGTVTQTPVFTPGSGPSNGPLSVTISSETDAVIYYTLDGSEPSTGSFQYNGVLTLTKSGNYTVKAKALKSGKSISAQASAIYQILGPNDFKIYFKHTAVPEAYVWYSAGGVTQEPFGKWASTAAMTSVPGKSGWYMADLGAKSVPLGTNVGVIFKIGSTKIYANDLNRDRTGWCQIVNGLPSWTDQCPDDVQAPTITASPSGGVMGNTQEVSVTINGNGSTVIGKTYSINGATAQPLSGSTITLDAAALAEGATMTLTITAINSVGPAVLGPLTFTKDTSTVVYPDTLGAVYTKKATKFRLWSPDSANVTVDVNGSSYNLSKVADFAGYTDVYEVTVPGDLALKTYQFKVNGASVRDPYGKMVQPGTITNVVIDLDAPATQPNGGFSPRPGLVNREDSIVYEAHIRDFTIDSTSGVDANKQGKFLGMVQTGTSYQGVKTGIDHLKELGVTHIQILPFYDFGSGMYNWGYDPVNYNVPEDQYSMTPNDPANRIKEIREMVNEFHKNGIRVVMDVVYNHTYGNEMFNGITNKYFTGNNDSGCGNGINTGVPMVSRMIRDSLEYWIDKIGVDGFRFDLIGVFHYTAVNEWGVYLNNKFADKNILLYGEPWNGYWLDDPIEKQKVRMGTVPAISEGHVGVFNGKYREDIKGNNDGTSKAYMFNAGISWAGAIASGSRGSLLSVKSTSPLGNLWDSMFAYDPEQSINYISAHDNFGLWDKIYLSIASNVVQAGKDSGKEHQVLSFTAPSSTTLDYGKRVVRFSMGMILTSQGIPFIHAGDEFLRTKTSNQDISNASAWQYQDKGTHNTYNAPDSFNSLKWGRKVENISTYNYFKDAITMRKANSGFRLTTWDEINARVQTRMKTAPGGVPVTADSSLPGLNEVINYIDQDGNVGNGYELVVVFNPANSFNVTLPAGSWTKIFDINGAVSKTDTACEGSAVTVFKKN